MQEIKDDILLYEAITISFQDDEELLNEYHIVTTKILKDCTMDTYSKIIEATDMLSLKWFLLKNNNDEIIGFCVLSKINNYLYSFAVNKKYRKVDSPTDILSFPLEKTRLLQKTQLYGHPRLEIMLMLGTPSTILL